MPLTRPLEPPHGTVIHSARLVADGNDTADAWVRIDDGRVSASGTGDTWRADAGAQPIDAAAVAGPGAVLAPGFIDIHGHGGGGASYDDGLAAIVTARRAHLAHGTTRAVLSLVTAPLDRLAERVAAVADAVAGDPTVLGSHLEGPFLEPAHRGAHRSDLLRHPDAAAIDLLLDAGRGTVAQLTLAPELPGALDAIRHAVERGVTVAVGHTGAGAAATRAAFDAGATILTHAFNAMPGLHHRAPGPLGAASADGRVTWELIADGIHLDPDIVRLAFRLAPGRVALITDAMAAAGHGDGDHLLGGRAVRVAGGVARAADGVLAGSTLTQDAALRTAVAAGVPLGEAITSLTRTPARAIGRPELGSLAVGSTADAVLLDEALHVRRVMVGRV
ncbi:MULTISPECIES: N-acetylglucosamine-6-phosphate deacetylase [unclassified Microbacterium]|uniref:N-acetylglucosamine-6-phosphate deacetylase n=1 Tax=unclassified Microbacterium TaxID=2609290 RepID=UPI003869BE9A